MSIDELFKIPSVSKLLQGFRQHDWKKIISLLLDYSAMVMLFKYGGKDLTLEEIIKIIENYKRTKYENYQTTNTKEKIIQEKFKNIVKEESIEFYNDFNSTEERASENYFNEGSFTKLNNQSKLRHNKPININVSTNNKDYANKSNMNELKDEISLFKSNVAQFGTNIPHTSGGNLNSSRRNDDKAGGKYKNTTSPSEEKKRTNNNIINLNGDNLTLRQKTTTNNTRSYFPKSATNIPSVKSCLKFNTNNNQILIQDSNEKKQAEKESVFTNQINTKNKILREENKKINIGTSTDDLETPNPHKGKKKNSKDYNGSKEKVSTSQILEKLRQDPPKLIKLINKNGELTTKKSRSKEKILSTNRPTNNYHNDIRSTITSNKSEVLSSFNDFKRIFYNKENNEFSDFDDSTYKNTKKYHFDTINENKYGIKNLNLININKDHISPRFKEEASKTYYENTDESLLSNYHPGEETICKFYNYM